MANIGGIGEGWDMKCVKDFWSYLAKVLLITDAWEEDFFKVLISQH